MRGLILSSVLLSAACAPSLPCPRPALQHPLPPPPQAPSASIDAGIVARVDEKSISLDDVQRRARVLLLTWGHVEREQEVFRAALDMLINEEVLLAEARRLGIGVTEQELEQHLRETMRAEAVSEEAYWSEVQRVGWTKAEFRRFMWISRVGRKVLDLEVGRNHRLTKADIIAAYEYWLTSTHTPDLRMLVVPRSGADDSGSNTARSLVQRLSAGEDFCKIVRQYSSDELSKRSCGQVHVGVLRQHAPVLAGAVAKLREGEISQPVAIGDTLVIVKLMKASLTLEDAERVLGYVTYRKTLVAAEAEWLDRLRGRSAIWLNTAQYPFLARQAPPQPVAP